MTPLKLGDKVMVFGTADWYREDGAIGIHGRWFPPAEVRPDPTPILEALVKVLESNVEDARQELLTLAESPSSEDREIAASAQATVEAGTAAIARAREWLEGKG